MDDTFDETQLSHFYTHLWNYQVSKVQKLQIYM